MGRKAIGVCAADRLRRDARDLWARRNRETARLLGPRFGSASKERPRARGSSVPGRSYGEQTRGHSGRRFLPTADGIFRMPQSELDGVGSWTAAKRSSTLGQFQVVNLQWACACAPR